MSKDICSVVLTSDISVPMSVKPRSNCIKEHSRNLELEAEILKVKQLLVETKKDVLSLKRNIKNSSLNFKSTKNVLKIHRIKNDSPRYENVSIKKRYQDLYQSKAESNSNVSSGAAVPEKPKVLPPSLYVMMPKYVPPQKRNNMKANTPLPRKETVSLVKNTNVCVNHSTGIKSVTEASKSKSKCETKTHRNLPARSENVKRVDNPLRDLNKRNRVDSSLSVKHTGFISKSVPVCNIYCHVRFRRFHSYIHGEEPKQALPLPEFVPEPVYLEFMPLEEEILLAEEQPLPATDSPTSDSPRHIPESDPEEDPADYPANEGDDDDDESSEDDEDDDNDVEEDEDEDEEEKDEHPALVDSISPPPVYRTTTRISISVQPPTPFWSEAEIDRLLTIPSPPPSPLSPWLRVETLSTSHPLPSSTPPSGTPPLLSVPLPISSPPLLLPSTSHKEDVLKVTLPPQKRLCIALGLRFKVVRVHLLPLLDLREASEQTVALLPLWMMRLETDENYGRLDDAQDDRVLMSGQLNMLSRDRCIHARTTRLMENEARISHEAWVQSIDASDIARAEVMSLRTTVLAQQTETQMATLQRRRGPARGPSNPEELALMCARMFLEESDKIERYIGGLPDMNQGSVMASNPKTMQDNQQQNKKQNTGRAYTARSSEKKPYRGSKSLCSKCNYHHDGQCALKCDKCNRVGHLACDCRSVVSANTANNQRGTRARQKPTCFECGAQGHFKRKCPKLKSNNQGNPSRNSNAPAKVYAVGHAETNPDSIIVMSTLLLNNSYASILIDTGADRSFMSTAFSSQIDITPTTLDHYYDVELADGRIIGLNTMI
nr:hypothetical protein [Tanacetum cinerariifolium]